jgi:hypothetical protein
MFGSRGPRVIVVHELGSVREDLRRALDVAGERERPGLEAALGILTGYRDDELRRRWVLRILGDASVDPRTHEVRAVKALRDAVPGLSLTDAVAFVREAAR